MEQESKEDSVGRDENKSAGISCQVLPGEDTQVSPPFIHTLSFLLYLYVHVQYVNVVNLYALSSTMYFYSYLSPSSLFLSLPPSLSPSLPLSLPPSLSPSLSLSLSFSKVCGVCHEQLEQFWEEEEEEWHFKDALRTGDGVLYHSYCYADSKEVCQLAEDCSIFNIFIYGCFYLMYLKFELIQIKIGFFINF